MSSAGLAAPGGFFSDTDAIKRLQPLDHRSASVRNLPAVNLFHRGHARKGAGDEGFLGAVDVMKEKLRS